jgi:thiol-disulfide isomerase/thioredoxin
MVKKINASFMCVVLTHMCFASGGTRNSLHAVADAAVAGSVPQTATSPESCVSKIDQLTDRVYREARESGRQVDAKELMRQKRDIANKCAVAFSINSVAAEQLSALAKLYFEAHRQSQANKAISRYLKSPRVSEADKARILRMAIDYSLDSAPAAGRSALAEEYLALFDQLGAAVTRQRMSAHLRLVEHYLSGRDDAKVLWHETEIVNLSKALPVDAQKAALDEVIETIDLQALLACSDAGAARARAIIEQIPSELVRLAHAEEWIGAVLSRYRMDGQDAPQLFPRNVLNAPNSEGFSRVQKGQVTVMLFAAYWCGPCHAIYPHVVDIYRRFQDNGIRVLLVTQLSNPANDPKAPKPEEELATIRRFYVDELKIRFPVVIEGPVDGKPSGDKSIDQQKANRQWRLFSFYPMILVIDKKGRTRAILIGTQPGQAERMRAKVEELLREPA